jgi:uncharacterized membrane protein YgcG
MTMWLVGITIFVGLLALAIAFNSRQKNQKRARRETEIRFIETYSFPAALATKLSKHFPHLTSAQIGQIVEGLRQWFVLLAMNRGKKFGMPSKAVDMAWHEFILMTRHYDAFCEAAFGEYLHHTQNDGGHKRNDERLALARSYALAPATATLMTGAAVGTAVAAVGLFDVDRTLGIEGGFHYDDAAREEMMRRHTANQQGDGGSVGVSVSSDSRDESGGHGVSPDSGGDGGGGDGGSGGCGGGCGS